MMLGSALMLIGRSPAPTRQGGYFIFDPQPIDINAGYGELWFGDRQMTGKIRVILSLTIYFDANLQATRATITLKEFWAENVQQFIEQEENGRGLLKIVAYNPMMIIMGDVPAGNDQYITVPWTGFRQGDNLLEGGIFYVFPLNPDGTPDKSKPIQLKRA